jgi:hypothetical protein
MKVVWIVGRWVRGYDGSVELSVKLLRPWSPYFQPQRHFEEAFMLEVAFFDRTELVPVLMI